MKRFWQHVVAQHLTKTLSVGFSFNLSPICVWNVWYINYMYVLPHTAYNVFFPSPQAQLFLWPTLFCGPHYDNCQVLPLHSPQHKDYKAHPQHLLYQAPGSSPFWKLFYCRTTSICHPTPRGHSKYSLFSTSRNFLTLLFSVLFTGCQYLQEFNWKHRFWLTPLPMLPLPPLPSCLHRVACLST